MSKQNYVKMKDELSQTSNVNDMLISVANEFRSPLISSKAACQLLLSEEPGKLTDEQKRLITITLDHIKNMEKAMEIINTQARQK